MLFLDLINDYPLLQDLGHGGFFVFDGITPYIRSIDNTGWTWPARGMGLDYTNHNFEKKTEKSALQKKDGKQK